jgi:hypothetical protein
MAKSEKGEQTAAERRAAETELRGLVERFAPAEARLVAAVRRWLRERLPTAHELVYEYSGFFVVSFSPSGHGYEGLFALRGDATGVRLYFNQSRGLPDPAKSR